MNKSLSQLVSYGSNFIRHSSITFVICVSTTDGQMNTSMSCSSGIVLFGTNGWLQMVYFKVLPFSTRGNPRDIHTILLFIVSSLLLFVRWRYVQYSDSNHVFQSLICIASLKITKSLEVCRYYNIISLNPLLMVNYTFMYYVRMSSFH